MLGEQVGQLKITRQLGAGGMGAVYLGVHAVLGVKRAIKFLLPELTQNPLLVQRFLNETRAAGKLAHRNIVQVHDVGQLPNGMYFIVFDSAPYGIAIGAVGAVSIGIGTWLWVRRDRSVPTATIRRSGVVFGWSMTF